MAVSAIFIEMRKTSTLECKFVITSLQFISNSLWLFIYAPVIGNQCHFIFELILLEFKCNLICIRAATIYHAAGVQPI